MKERPAPLDFETYQREALKTDRVGCDGDEAILVPLLGLVGEIGTLAVEHKKRIRDKDKHRLFKSRIEEDVGDILWYLSNFASKNGFRLEEVAAKNLHKVRSRWALPTGAQLPLFDATCAPPEQLPRHFEIEFRVDKKSRVRLFRDGVRVGDALTDNNYRDDGYRFHDIFHLAYAAVLGWSPVTRKLLKCKRKSDTITDNVEDGGRAAVIEEGIAAMAYAVGKDNDFFQGHREIEHSILETIQRMTAHLEVHLRSVAEWERAILLGFSIWRELRQHNGGRVTVDLTKQQLFYASAPTSDLHRVRTDSRAAIKIAPPRPRLPAKRANRLRLVRSIGAKRLTEHGRIGIAGPATSRRANSSPGSNETRSRSRRGRPPAR